MEVPRSLSWQAYEYDSEHKSVDWYWAISIIAVSLCVLLVFFGNLLMAAVVLLGALAAALQAHRGPHMANYEINQRGVIINDRLYPYVNLESFWIDHHTRTPKVLIRSEKLFMTFLSLPLPGNHDDEELIRQFLLQHLPEVEHREPFLQKLLEHIGF
jgi:hypothetical protein